MGKTTARRVGLNKEIILEKAIDLSQSKGIEGWSIRDIARELDVVPSVIYHYYPHKEALCDSVVDRVCADIELPAEDLDWKAWFKAVAQVIRPVLLRYYGITDRFARGKFTTQFLPVIDIAYEKLIEAGFGDKAELAYVIITNSVIHTIGARNLRSVHQTGERHDLDAMLERFKPMMKDSVGLSMVVANYLGPLSDPECEEELSQKYYDLTIASVLEGAESVLLPQANNSSDAQS
ncbi:TetR/AcrR family transcriptional regulator [Arcanobacterium phocae]|uniref:TetR/AcrR family transcriptional regulator n=1 Tax=Arcanobacterium phocae TaxID=131112 RepID=UPI001C0F20F9|nr:TetR/AcrR family transcriptional regulator [Arcanobacterium phocae]